MEGDDRRAWQDWQRVEACLMFGLRRYGFTVLALWASEHWLRPLSSALMLGADAAILSIHFAVVRAEDAKRMRPSA